MSFADTFYCLGIDDKMRIRTSFCVHLEIGFLDTAQIISWKLLFDRYRTIDTSNVGMVISNIYREWLSLEGYAEGVLAVKAWKKNFRADVTESTFGIFAKW